MYQSSDDMQTIHSARLEKVEEERLTEISVNHRYDGLSNNRKRDEDGVTKRIALNSAAGQSALGDPPGYPNELFYQESTHSGSPIKNQLQGKLSVCFFGHKCVLIFYAKCKLYIWQLLLKVYTVFHCPLSCLNNLMNSKL